MMLCLRINLKNGGESLREKEDKISAEFNNRLKVHKGNMSLYELAEIYVNKRWKEVRESTRKRYMTQLKFLKNQAFAKRKITDILPLEAEELLSACQEDNQRKEQHMRDKVFGILDLGTILHVHC